MRKLTLATVVLLTVGMLAASPAQGCGACVEERMAATYYHELATVIREINRRLSKQPIRVSLIRTMSPQEVAAR